MSGGPQDPGESDGEISGLIDDVFAILGDETRIEILLELAEVAREERTVAVSVSPRSGTGSGWPTAVGSTTTWTNSPTSS
jgi:hypothetical protein